MFRRLQGHALQFFKPYLKNLFLITIQYKVPLSQVDEYLDAHKAFLDECYKNKKFITSGRKVPRTGGLILASLESRIELEELIEKDPFKKYDLAEYEITEFLPTMYCDDFSKIAEEDISIRKSNKN